MSTRTTTIIVLILIAAAAIVLGIVRVFGSDTAFRPALHS